MKKIKGFKGFDKGLSCRGFQFEENKEFVEDKSPVACESGFHPDTTLDELRKFAEEVDNQIKNTEK